jgi:hypothetical protein
MPFGLQESSSVLTRVMHSAMTRGLHTDDAMVSADCRSSVGGVPGTRGPLHRSVVDYMDDILCYSPTLEQHI